MKLDTLSPALSRTLRQAPQGFDETDEGYCRRVFGGQEFDCYGACGSRIHWPGVCDLCDLQIRQIGLGRFWREVEKRQQRAGARQAATRAKPGERIGGGKLPPPTDAGKVREVAEVAPW